MIKAVFDTTVLVSAFRSRSGVTGELLGLADAAFLLFLASGIIDETREVLRRPRLRRGATYTDEDVEEYIRALEALATVVDDLPPISGVVRDPNDDMVVACAVKAQADCIVTRDKDLLSLGSYQGIAITTPEQFRMALRRRAR